MVTVPVPPVAALLDAGNNGEMVKVKVTDFVGLHGTALLEIPKRVLTVSPHVSGIATPLTIEGTGFPADNPVGDTAFNASVRVTYVGDFGIGTDSTRVTPDATGSFTTTLRVPARAIVPRTTLSRRHSRIEMECLPLLRPITSYPVV